MRGRLHLYLSPRYDDVCFSLGELAWRRGGEVVNLFTRGENCYLPLRPAATREELVAPVGRIRRREHGEFARACGLRCHDLVLDEPSLLGHDPFDLDDLRQEIARIEAVLLPWLERRFGDSDRPEIDLVLVPMAIRGHRNHASTLAFVRRHLRLFAGRRLALYEDLPYASHGPAREAGLAKARALFDGYGLARHVTALTPAAMARKMDHVRLYRSQFVEPPLDRHFSPGLEPAAQPHEAVWTVTAPSA